MSKNRRGSHQPSVGTTEHAFIVISKSLRSKEVLLVRYAGETFWTLPRISYPVAHASYSMEYVGGALEIQFPKTVFCPLEQARHHFKLNDEGKTCSVRIFITRVKSGPVIGEWNNDDEQIVEQAWGSFPFIQRLATPEDGYPGFFEPLLSTLIAKPPQLPVK